MPFTSTIIEPLDHLDNLEFSESRSRIMKTLDYQPISEEIIKPAFDLNSSLVFQILPVYQIALWIIREMFNDQTVLDSSSTPPMLYTYTISISFSSSYLGTLRLAGCMYVSERYISRFTRNDTKFRITSNFPDSLKYH